MLADTILPMEVIRYKEVSINITDVCMEEEATTNHLLSTII